jgi:hypothetical protein
MAGLDLAMPLRKAIPYPVNRDHLDSSLSDGPVMTDYSLKLSSVPG